MKFHPYETEAEFAIQGVRRIAQLVADIRREMAASAFTKDDRSPVTVADFTAQAVMGRLLLDRFPEDRFVSEEDSGALTSESERTTLQHVTRFARTVFPDAVPEKVCMWIDHGSAESSSRFWTMDPIDGTKGFLRGDQYAVALALIVDGEIKVGVLGCPNLRDARRAEPGCEGSLIAAVRSQGAWHQNLSGGDAWKKLNVSCRCRAEEAVILRSVEKQHVDTSRTSQLIQQLGLRTPPLLMDSLAKYAVLASGEADLLLRFPTEKHPYECIWDQAPGVIIVEEAGGQVTDLDGKAFDYTTGRKLTKNRGVLVSNRHLHPILLKTLASI